MTVLRTLRTVLALLLALTGLLVGVAHAGAAPGPVTDTDTDTTTQSAGTAAGEWQDGRSDSDTIIDVVTQQPGTGISAQTGWRTDSGQVPRVGEAFYVRGYVGLVSLPASGTAAVLPEVLLPAGVEYADDVKPVRWAFGRIDEPQEFRTAELSYARGRNGGLLVGTPDGNPWTLRQQDVLEIQVPVRATRALKGPATQKPECRSRRDGTAPCPVGQAGDHLQIAFTVSGHDGDKSYVTPYVGLFAQDAAPARSTTAASYRKVAGGRWQAAVTVRATGRTATGRVTVLDKGRAIGTGSLGAGGKVTVRLPRLARGAHVLTTRYAGSTTVAASTSPAKRLTVR